MSLKAVDFFCGGGGMSFGLSKAGINVLAGIDNDPKVQETYEANHAESLFLLEDISSLSPMKLGRKLGLKKRDDELVFIGCSPCQYWSLINTDKKKSKNTAYLLESFQRHVEYFKPGYILIENVPGLSKKHGTPLIDFKKLLQKSGYTFIDGVLNCNDYKVPQNRLRYVLLASRLGDIRLPDPMKGKRPSLRDVIGKGRNSKPVYAGQVDQSPRFNSVCKLSKLNLRRLKKTPKDGGNRLAWKDDKTLQLNAYIGKDNHFKDVYARMYWDKPSPTITTKYISYSNGRFGHPEQNRALSVREGATIQSFPASYKIISNSIVSAAKIIGNAVPPKFAYALGKEIQRSDSERNKKNN